MVVDLGLQRSLQLLRDQLQESSLDSEKFRSWWRTNRVTWNERSRETIAEHRNIQQDWNFSPEQESALQSYYTANQLLMDCLNSDCEVTASVRLEIESALLLPRKELEEREWK
jgi:predicted NACHT family NTPase